MSNSLPALLVQIKEAVGAIGKDSKNPQQGFMFRGIDAVINAAAPAMIEAGVSVFPKVLDYQYGTVEVGSKRTPMGHARVIVEYTFVGPEGDTLTGSAPGEAMDSGDKATAKAMSVAFRTFLLQALSLPTNEPDPDAAVYERADPTELADAVAAVQAAWTAAHDGVLDMDALAADYRVRYGGDIRLASPAQLRAYSVQRLADPPERVAEPGVQDHLARATAPAGAKS